MNEKGIDKNFIHQEAVDADTQWYDARNLTIYGVMPDEELLSRRMPKQIAEQVNAGVGNYSDYGAGGRIRFSTNSPYVAIKVHYGTGSVPTVMNYCGSYGFDLYGCQDDREVYLSTGRPTHEFDHKYAEYKLDTHSAGKVQEYTLNFPIFCAIEDLQIGVETGSVIGPGKAYRNSLPVVYYGSSITHGAAAGRPGNTYEGFISQKYNLDYINLGFSGSAKGEPIMAQYIAGIPMSVFVCDYDYNASTPQYLAQTHFPFYETFRKAQPDTPFIMISRPNFFNNPEPNGRRREIIRSSYEKALALGDKHVYFIDGETLFSGECAESCTSDSVHPNDLGFFRMAQVIGPVVMQAYEASPCK